MRKILLLSELHIRIIEFQLLPGCSRQTGKIDIENLKK